MATPAPLAGTSPARPMKASIHPSRRRPAAFTLVEMMVVVAIIAIMLAVAGAFMKPSDASRAIHAATREMQTLVESARMRAMSSGNQTALLIYNKSDDVERYLNFVMVVERRQQKAESASGGDDEGTWEWVPVGNGSHLAKGAFYWPKEGTAFTEQFAGDGQFNLGTAFSGNKGDWIGIIFTPQGIPVGRGALQENPILLIAKGELSTSGLDVTPGDKNRAEAFMIQRSNGRIVPVENPVDQLKLD